MGENRNAGIGAVAGFLIGLFLPGLGPLAGAKYGLALGSLFDRHDQDSPTYTWTLDNNPSTDRLPVAVIYGTHKFTGNVIYEYHPGPVRIEWEKVGTATILDGWKDNGGKVYTLSKTGVLADPKPNVFIRYWRGFSYIDCLCGPNFHPYAFYSQTSQIVFESGIHTDDAITYFGDLLPAVGWELYVDYSYIPDTVSTFKAQIGLCEGPIQNITDIKINDINIENIPDCTVTPYLGTAMQTSDPLNPNNEAFRNLAYLNVQVAASEFLNGTPKITCKVQGKKVKVWDDVAGKWVERWSNNPAYCLLDWLTNSRYGCGVPVHKIDTATFIEAAEYCAERVTGSLARYELNLAIDSEMEAARSIDLILKTFGGILIYSDGKIKLKVERSETPVFAFNTSNIVAGSFSYTPTPKRREIPNRLYVEFIDPQNPAGPWEPARLLIEDELDQEERGEVVETSLQLWGVTNRNQAGRLGWLLFDYARYCPEFCSFRIGMSGIAVEVGDVVTVTHPLPGWVNKKFRILSVELGDNEALVTARAYNGNIYHDRAVEYVEGNVTTLPNPFDVLPDVETVTIVETSSTDQDGHIISGLDVSCSPINCLYFSHFVVQLSINGGPFTTKGNTPEGEKQIDSFRIEPIAVGSKCIVKVRTVSTKGKISPGTISPELTIVGNTSTPDTPNAPSVTSGIKTLGVDWGYSLSPDHPLDYFTLQYSLAEATWNAANLRYEVPNEPVWGPWIDCPGGQGKNYSYIVQDAQIDKVYRFRVRFKDIFGNYSDWSAATFPTPGTTEGIPQPVNKDDTSPEVQVALTDTSIRHCILECKMDASNLPMFIQAGTGLNIDIFASNNNPFTVAIAYGSSENGTVDYVARWTHNVSNAWVNLPANSMLFLYIDRAKTIDGTITLSYAETPCLVGKEFNRAANALLHFDGVHLSTDIEDEYQNNVTLYGNTRLSTIEKKFGTASVYFDGDGDFLDVAIPCLGMEPWVIECWFKFKTTPQPGAYATILSSTTGYSFRIRASALYAGGDTFFRLELFLSSNGASWNIANAVTGTTHLFRNNWYKLALVWTGTHYIVYLGEDGSSVSADITVASNNPVYQNNAIRLAANNQGINLFNGYIDEFRFTSGSYRRYGGIFIPETEAFTPDVHWFDLNVWKTKVGKPEGWTDYIRLFVGEVITNGSSVMTVKGYNSSGIYDSGWFDVENATDYNLVTNLGADPSLIQTSVQFRESANFAAASVTGITVDTAGNERGAVVGIIDRNNIKLRTANTYVNPLGANRVKAGSGGTYTGQYRIMATRGY